MGVSLILGHGVYCLFTTPGYSAQSAPTIVSNRSYENVLERCGTYRIVPSRSVSDRMWTGTWSSSVVLQSSLIACSRIKSCSEGKFDQKEHDQLRFSNRDDRGRKCLHHQFACLGTLFILADLTPTQYDRLLAQSCRLFICPSISLSVTLRILALRVGVQG